MLQFRKLTISDRDWTQPFIEAEDSRSADYNFGNIYMWDTEYSGGGRDATLYLTVDDQTLRLTAPLEDA